MHFPGATTVLFVLALSAGRAVLAMEGLRCKCTGFSGNDDYIDTGKICKAVTAANKRPEDTLTYCWGGAQYYCDLDGHPTSEWDDFKERCKNNYNPGGSCSWVQC